VPALQARIVELTAALRDLIGWAEARPGVSSDPSA
jgi:hypothetical protein